LYLVLACGYCWIYCDW